jgi:ATP-dependent Clp protease ATP-binding subunit ClpC
MFERFSDGARRVVSLAKIEAEQDRSPSIESEHLLQGIITADIERVVAFIGRAPRDNMQEKVLRAKKVNYGGSGGSDASLSGECKRVLGYAAEEADHVKSERIEIDHLLLGMLREPKSVGGRILVEQGLELGALRQKLGGSPEMTVSQSFGGKLKKLFGGK